MQCLTRQIASLAIDNNTMYWGVKIDGDDNDHADALSRFKSYAWKTTKLVINILIPYDRYMSN